MRLRRGTKTLSADQRRIRRAKRLRLLAQVLTFAGWIGGWLVVTLGVYGLLSLWITAWWVWPISVGLLMLGFAGYRSLLLIFKHGVYVLSEGIEEEY